MFELGRFSHFFFFFSFLLIYESEVVHLDLSSIEKDRQSPSNKSIADHALETDKRP